MSNSIQIESQLPAGYQTAMDAMNKRIEAALGEGFRVIYSAYKEDTKGVPIDNLEEVAHVGQIVFVDVGRAAFEGNAKGYVGKVLTNPTWLDLCKVANEIILEANYVDHVYLEGIKPLRTISNITVAKFYFGS